MNTELELTLDSGAYSAFTQGKAIDVVKYADFCLEKKDYINTVVNLDVINPQDPEVAAQAGMNNFNYMLDRGVKAMPVFHARERIQWLDEMIDKTDYIGLSGTSLVSPVENRGWHKLIWNHITDIEGKAIAKFHAFGDTSSWSMLTYPWYSADSATWMIQSGRAARVKLNGKVYQFRSKKIGDVNYISKDDTGLKRQAWEAEFISLGLNPDKAMNVPTRGAEMAMIRAYMVAKDILNLKEQCAHVTKYAKPNTLILPKKKQVGGKEREGSVKIHFVISPSAHFFNFPVILALGIKDILVSYYYVITAQKDFWEKRMVPFLVNPHEFCHTDPKIKRYLDKLNEVLLVPV